MFVPGPGALKHAFVALVLLAVMAAPAGAAPSCRIPSGTTVATGKIAKLISVPKPGGRVLFACIRRTGRKKYLDDDPRVPQLAGRWVAWEHTRRADRIRIVVHDLRTGRERLVVGRVARTALVLTTRGTIVWAQENPSSTITPLYANDTATGGRLLDSGDVDPGSLRLAGRRVSWRSGGMQRSTVVR